VIPPAAFDFLRGLAANNEKAWFEANRATYESAVRVPVAALVASVTTELTKRGVPLEGDPKRSTFRIHRDVRFSKDKSPYKTHVGSVWHRQGSGRVPGAGVLYFHLDPAGCFAAAAFYHPEPEVLDSIRERIRVYPDRFLAVQAALAQAGLQLGQADMLSRMPKGFEDLKGSEVDPALRLRSFVVRRDLLPKQVHGKGLAGAIAGLAEDALPLLRFGWDAVDEVQRAA
jgi:uncharacterized protein (TIGR02453 family)